MRSAVSAITESKKSAKGAPAQHLDAISKLTLLDASKEKMFASLVPDSSAKALSRYTEMVDDVIRTQAEKLQQASEFADRVRLKEMDLPDSILALEGNFTLPMELKEDVEAVQISGGPAGLEAELQQLRDLRRVKQEMLVQIAELQQNMIAVVKILPAILRHKNNCCCKSRFNSLFDCIFFLFIFFEYQLSFFLY